MSLKRTSGISILSMEDTSRRQYKSTVNNIETNLAPSEPSDATSARLEHPKAEEAENIDLKITFKR